MIIVYIILAVIVIFLAVLLDPRGDVQAASGAGAVAGEGESGP